MMKRLKFVIIMALTISLFLPATAGKRKSRIPMKELTDPNSPSYVPFPYPKTREELIADIKWYYVDLTADAQSGYVGGEPLSSRVPKNMFKRHKPSAYTTKESRENILKDMYNPDTIYRIGKILKVKHCEDRIPDDYYWLIYVMDQGGEAIYRISMQASGLGLMGSAMDKSLFTHAPKKSKEIVKRHLHVISKKEVKKSFAAVLGDIAADSKIVKLERIGFSARVGSFTEPLWVIKLTGGETYYYEELSDTVYKVAKIIQWKKVNGNRGHPRHNRRDHNLYIPDRVNDEYILLDPLPRKKQ